MQTNDRDIKNKVKELIKYNYYFILTLLFLLLVFREYLPIRTTFAIILIIVFDLILDFSYGIKGKIKKTFYLNYIKYYRRFVFYTLASLTLILDYSNSRVFSSVKELGGILFITITFIFYFAITGTVLKVFKDFLAEEIKTAEVIRYFDSIFWLSIIYISGILKSPVIAIMLVSLLTSLYLIRLRDKKILNPEKYQTYFSRTRVFFFIAVIIAAIIENKLKLRTSYEFIGVYFLYLLLRLASSKQPEPEYIKGTIGTPTGIKDKSINSILRNKYSEKIYDLSFVLSESNHLKLREYYKNVKEVVPRISREKIFGVLPKLNISEHAKSALFRVDIETYRVMLEELNIRENTKEEIKNLLKENPERIIVISEAAFEPDWIYGKRYLVFEVAEENRLKIRSPLLRNSIRSANSYSRVYMKMGISLLLRNRSKIKEYQKRIKNLGIAFSKMNVVLVYGKNLKGLLPVLNIPGKVKNEFAKMVKNNKIIVVSEAAFLPEWKWDEKYIVIDPEKIPSEEDLPMRRRIITESAIYGLAIGISILIFAFVIPIFIDITPLTKIHGGILLLVLWLSIMFFVTYILIRTSNSKGIITPFEDTIKPVMLTTFILGGLIISISLVISKTDPTESQLSVYKVLLMFGGLFLVFYLPSILAKKGK